MNARPFTNAQYAGADGPRTIWPSLNDDALHRLFNVSDVLRDGFTLTIAGCIVGLLIVVPIVARFTPEPTRGDVYKRWRGWLMLVPLILVPILLGAFWTWLAVALLAFMAYREFARATGLFRERVVSAAVVLAMLVVYFATLDHYYAFFVALWPLGVSLITLAGLARDKPHGYLQRTALGVLAFMLFGAGLGHLAYFTNDPMFRRVLLWIIVCVQMNDIFAYTSGKLFGPMTGGKKLAPNTSPNKTIAGAIGAVVLTTGLTMLLGRWAWTGTTLAGWGHLLVMGVMISLLGQAGDLLLSAIKRDVGVKDLGHLFPGHGGLLDRFDSLMLVSAALFHYIGYNRGVGLDQLPRIISYNWF